MNWISFALGLVLLFCGFWIGRRIGRLGFRNYVLWLLGRERVD